MFATSIQEDFYEHNIHTHINFIALLLRFFLLWPDPFESFVQRRCHTFLSVRVHQNGINNCRVDVTVYNIDKQAT